MELGVLWPHILLFQACPTNPRRRGATVAVSLLAKARQPEAVRSAVRTYRDVSRVGDAAHCFAPALSPSRGLQPLDKAAETAGRPPAGPGCQQGKGRGQQQQQQLRHLGGGRSYI